jgi:hypothetical protein
MGLNSSKRNVIIGIAFAVTLLLTGVAGPLGIANATQSSSLTVNAYSVNDNTSLGMWAEIRSGDKPVKSGFTPLTITGTTGAKYMVTVHDYQNFRFDHWKGGDASKTTTVTLSSDTTLTALYKTGTRQQQSTLYVSALSANNETLHMWATIKSNGAVQKAGLTPFTFRGEQGKTYQLTLGNYGVESFILRHWQDRDDTFRGSTPSIIFNHWADTNGVKQTREITMQPGTLSLTGIYNKGDRVTLQDLGVLQLVSHDLYNTIRDGPNPGSIEDERLNLSTVLDHGQDKIIVGGEPRNSENIAIHTVAVKLGKMYLDLVAQGKTPEEARELTRTEYLRLLDVAYRHAFHEPLPAPAPNPHEEKPDGTENLTGDLSLRAVHSYVPGHIMVNGTDTPILDPSLRGKTLSDRDMRQLSKPLDGTFDPVFRNVTIFLPPPAPAPNAFVIDLFERDNTFATQFGTDYSFEHFMGELKDGRSDASEQVMNYLREDVAGGLQTTEEEEE